MLVPNHKKGYKLLSCLHTDRPARLAYAKANPSRFESRKELIEKDLRQDVGRERIEIDDWYATNPPDWVVEWERLGVREENARILNQQGMNDNAIQQGIINERINEELRQLAAEEIKLRDKESGWVGQKLSSVGTAMNDVFNPARAALRFIAGPIRGANTVRYDTAEERRLEREMVQLFGQNRGNVPMIAQYIVNQLTTNFAPSMVRAAAYFMLTPATPAFLATWLETATVMQLEARSELVRQQQPRDLDFFRAYNLLLNVRRAEARERSKIVSINIYDPRRLHRFMDEIQNLPPPDNEVYEMMTEQIFEEGTIDDIDNNPIQQAMVAKLAFIYESNGRNITVLRGYVDNILEGLPDAANDNAEDKNENAELTKKIDAEYAALKKTLAEVRQQYQTAAANRRKMEAQLQIQTDLVAIGTLSKAEAKLLDTARKQIQKLEDERAKILQTTQTHEQEFRDKVDELAETLMESQDQNVPPPGTPLETLVNVATLNISTEDQLFRIGTGTISPLEDALTSTTIATRLDKAYFNTLTDQIDDDYKEVITGKEKIGAWQMLLYLNEQRLEDQGVMDANRRRTEAILNTNMEIAKVKSIDLYRAANREIGETLIGNFRGWRRRAAQSIATRFFSTNTFKDTDMINHTSLSDKEGKFKFLKGLKSAETLNDLRVHIEANHVDLETLQGARTHLQAILQGLEVQHEYVEIADDSWRIENLIHNFILLEAEMESREFDENVRYPKTAEDKKLSKAMWIKKLWAQTNDSNIAREKGISGKVAIFKNTLKKYLMKGLWGKDFEEGIEYCEKNNITGAAREEYLIKNKGILASVLPHLMRGLAVKEAIDIGVAGGKLIGSGLAKGAVKGAQVGAAVVPTVVSGAWNRVIKPGAEHGASLTGKALKGLFWTAPKFIVYDAPAAVVKNAVIRPISWAGRTTAKAVAFPFIMAGKAFSGLWHAVHYDPKAATARYAKNKDNVIHMGARKSKKAAGGHGAHGAGHGADHGADHGKVDLPHGDAANDNGHAAAA